MDLAKWPKGCILGLSGVIEATLTSCKVSNIILRLPFPRLKSSAVANKCEEVTEKS